MVYWSIEKSYNIDSIQDNWNKETVANIKVSNVLIHRVFRLWNENVIGKTMRSYIVMI